MDEYPEVQKAHQKERSIEQMENDGVGVKIYEVGVRKRKRKRETKNESLWLDDRNYLFEWLVKSIQPSAIQN